MNYLIVLLVAGSCFQLYSMESSGVGGSGDKHTTADDSSIEQELTLLQDALDKKQLTSSSIFVNALQGNSPNEKEKEFILKNQEVLFTHTQEIIDRENPKPTFEEIEHARTCHILACCRLFKVKRSLELILANKNPEEEQELITKLQKQNRSLREWQRHPPILLAYVKETIDHGVVVSAGVDSMAARRKNAHRALSWIIDYPYRDPETNEVIMPDEYNANNITKWYDELKAIDAQSEKLIQQQEEQQKTESGNKPAYRPSKSTITSLIKWGSMGAAIVGLALVSYYAYTKKKPAHNRQNNAYKRIPHTG